MKITTPLLQNQHKVVVLLGLGNPESVYAKTRHNVAALLLNSMAKQLATVSETNVATQHGLIARTKSDPGTKQFKKDVSRLFDLSDAKDQNIDNRKYLLNMNLLSTNSHGMKMLMMTPTISFNPAFDKENLSKYDLEYEINFNKQRTTYCFGYVDGAFMNNNGKVVAKFFSSQQDYFKENLDDVVVVNTEPNTELFNISNYILADDVEADIGKVKIRDQNSSDRGHNGYRSCRAHLGKLKNVKYSKLSLGINLRKWEDDLSSKMQLRDFVLGKFTHKEIEYLHDHTIPELWSTLKKAELPDK